MVRKNTVVFDFNSDDRDSPVSPLEDSVEKKTKKAPSPKKAQDSSSYSEDYGKDNQNSELEEGEVSDSDSGSGEASDEFNDGYDENLMGDEEDKTRLMQMTEREREQEIYDRVEKRDVLKTRFRIVKKLRLAKKKEQKMKTRKEEMEQKTAQVIKDLREKKRKFAELQHQKSEADDLKDEDDDEKGFQQAAKKLKASDDGDSANNSDDEDAN